MSKEKIPLVISYYKETLFSIWTDKPKSVNYTLAVGITNRQDAEIILEALKKKYS